MTQVFEVQTFNDAAESENKIHDDKIAAYYGFEGALVGGVVVFGHMTYLPIKSEGIDWLTNNQTEVRFIKPAYDKQVLGIEYDSDGISGEARCFNPEGTLIATLTSTHGHFEPDPVHQIQPAPAHQWLPTRDQNLKFAEQLEDDNSLYRQGESAPVHPFWMLRECNAAFTRSFLLPAWMHVGNKITFHQPLRVGQEIEVRMVPTDKWERKGHHFTTLYIAFLVQEEVYVEVEHTCIFRIAPPASSGVSETFQ